jgi:hypothetical protein
MSELFVMRRANGDIFAERTDGKLRILAWSGEDATERYKAHNPELIVFFPARLDRKLIQRVRRDWAEGEAELFLLSDDAPDADLDDGRPIPLAEIFPEDEAASQPAHSQV